MINRARRLLRRSSWMMVWAFMIVPHVAQAEQPTPTPTPASPSGPTVTVCPEKTPCVLGEQPLPCHAQCGLGCGCAPCPDCPDGTVAAPRFNVCECLPDPNVTPPPTPTPGGCFFPTPPLCPVGQTAQCVTADGCDNDCSCVPCDPCPEGEVYRGDPNGCLCVDPRSFTPTPIPGSATATPTPDICVFPTPPLCPTGETPYCVSTGCVVGCGCEPCAPCPDGLVFSGEINRCECVDPHAPTRTPTTAPCFFPTPPLCPVGQTADCPLHCDAGCVCEPCPPCPDDLAYSGAPNSCACADPRTPSERPTATPTPNLDDTPRTCPTRTPPLCDSGENIVCDSTVDPCGICECRALPQQPTGNESSVDSASGGGCNVSGGAAEATVWSWSLLLLALVRSLWARRHPE